MIKHEGRWLPCAATWLVEPGKSSLLIGRKILKPLFQPPIDCICLILSTSRCLCKGFASQTLEIYTFIWDIENLSLGFLPGIRRIKWIMTECCISAFSSLLLSHEKILKNDHFLSYHHTCLFQESRKKERDRGPFSNCFSIAFELAKNTVQWENLVLQSQIIF